VDAIKHIMAAHPENVWIGRILLAAENARRHASWTPLQVGDLGQLATTARARNVRDDTALADMAVLALDEIQTLLQADTPDAALLWDTHSRRPKAEDDISDYLRNRLKERLADSGIAVNREVQVKRITGIGERTDLRIDALTVDGPDQVITVVGEVKGCWYPDLVAPVRTQLVERYMKRVGSNVGIYVIIWFNQESWADDDGRRRVAATRTPDSIDADLSLVLADLRDEGIDIRVVHLDASR